MAKLLEKFAKSFKKSVTSEKPVVEKLSDSEKFSPYEAIKKSKESFTVTFEMADSDGNLSLVDEQDINIVLLEETFKESAPYYNKKIKDRFIGTIPMNVVVDKIDKQHNTVYVASAYGKDTIKGSLIKEIVAELKRGNKPRLSGIVTKVDERRAVINILNKDILGYLNVQDFQPIYTRSLTDFVQRGDFIEFEVTELLPRKIGVDFAFSLDRKNIAEDPWEKLPDFKDGASIVCKCVSRPKNKDFWWGVSKTVPGIEIICNYSDSVSVMNNCYYKCKVRHYDKEKHVLKAVPFEVVPVGIATEANISFAKKGRA